tara:strand:- start:30777 stop:31025 length:249 start_codon:yes stop_codon:yes gene_type:complete
MNFKNVLKYLNPKSFYLRLVILIAIIVGLHILLAQFSKKCTIENLDLPVSKKQQQQKETEKLLNDINNAKKKQQKLSKKLGK